ncbi:MAG: 50S ribosomal protein L29 [Patescibacteria group bacterium]
MLKKEKEQLKNQSSESLQKMVAESREKLWSLRTDLAAGKVKNVREIKKLKRLIAQSLTLINK